MSGVYILGMEIPSKCVECRIATKTDFDSCPFCDVTMRDLSKDEWWYERPQDCPLVPAPPHGRLIDADVVKRIIEEHDYMLRDPIINSTDRGMWTIGIFQAIDETPTIIPASGGKENE